MAHVRMAKIAIANAGFTRHAIAVTTPSSSHRSRVGRFEQRSAIAKINARAAIEKLVSQKSIGSQSRGGLTAHNVPATFETFLPKTLRAISIKATTVATPNKPCTVMITIADACLLYTSDA